jgi:hypothetical protein
MNNSVECFTTYDVLLDILLTTSHLANLIATELCILKSATSES